MKILDALALFLSAKFAAGLSAVTVDWYGGQVRAFSTWLQNQKPNGSKWLAPETIERFLAEERARGLAPASVDCRYRALSAFFTWMEGRTGSLGLQSFVNPMVAVKRPKVPKRRPRRAVLGDYLRLYESIPVARWIDCRDRLAISCMFLCGLRAGEVCGLRASDFDVTDGLLTVRSAKGGDDRIIPMLPAVACAFSVFVFARPPWVDDHVILSSSRSHLEAAGVLTPSGLRQMLRRRCAAVGIDYINPHAFRHGLAVHILNSGGDMSLVQRILGHKRISTTAEHYAEWVTDGLVAEFEKIMGE